MNPQSTSLSAGPLRRLGAMLYDALLLVAILIFATIPFLPFTEDKVLVPKEVGWLAYVYWIWQLCVIAAYFAIFWCKRGSTVGMQAWRLRVEDIAGGRVKVKDALSRLAWACVPWLPAFVALTLADYFSGIGTAEWISGLGFALLTLGFANYVFAYFDSRRRAWHDRFLTTRIVRFEKPTISS